MSLHQSDLVLKAIYREASTRGEHFAVSLTRMWSILLAFATDEEVIARNPAARLRLRSPAARQQCWAPGQVEAFCKAAIAAKKPSMAHAARLLYDTSQRVCDILRLPRSAREGDAVTLRQQ
jgi:hypothetical protein